MGKFVVKLGEIHEKTKDGEVVHTLENICDMLNMSQMVLALAYPEEFKSAEKHEQSKSL